jgi:hypothetical protein
MLTVCAALTVPAEAVNVALDCPAAMVAVAGTEITALELLSAIVAALPVDCAKETVHWLDELLVNDVGVQTSGLRRAWAITLSVKL